MILYDDGNFLDWLTCQPEWKFFPNRITVTMLHKLFIRFHELCEDEADALARDLDTRLSAERAAVHAARASAAMKNTADAVAAEVEARAEMIRRGM